jgi:hypothetical protein
MHTMTVAAIAALSLSLGAYAQTPTTEQAPATQCPKQGCPGCMMNTLTPAEQAAGWELLFDGRTTTSWRGYKQEEFPKQGWKVERGMLQVMAGGGGGDIITINTYTDFELALEFKVSEKANSGIIYRVTEEHAAPWMTGPEYQVLDDAGYGVEPTDSHAAGGLYDLIKPGADKISKPTGQWNQALIRIKGGQLEHWLNGVKVVACDMNGEDFAELIAKSKFNPYEGFGVRETGHICLQDHGNDVWFRNIKIRDLAKPMPGEIALFNGKDLEGFTAFSPDAEGAKDTWSVQDGMIVCKGEPAGYILTHEQYENFVLTFEWRYPAQAGNSGVLLRKTGEDKVWPRCFEAQLMSGHAGDFYVIDGFPALDTPQGSTGRRTENLATAENPVGAWNRYEIVLAGDRCTLYVNGKLVNDARNVERIPGSICFQSEGVPIHFRNIRLAPIAMPAVSGP